MRLTILTRAIRPQEKMLFNLAMIVESQIKTSMDVKIKSTIAMTAKDQA
jgi:hypothetical protein